MTTVQELRAAAEDSMDALYNALDEMDFYGCAKIANMGSAELAELIVALHEIKDRIKDAHPQSP